MTDGSEVRVVRDERDVVRAVREAARDGVKIRATGSGGSKNGAYKTQGTILRTSAMNDLIAVHDRMVTVSPGMTCGRLNELLAAHGLVLPQVGEWQWATIAGSLATATHGGSAHSGIMATAVRAVQFVDGTGEVRRIERGHPDFEHVVVSLGAMGVQTAVTLECVPRFALQMDLDVISFADYVRDPVGNESRTEFHAAVWVPSARRVIRYAAERSTRCGEIGNRPLRFGPRTVAASLLSRAMKVHGAVSRSLFEHSIRGDCGNILTPIGMAPRLVKWAWSFAGNMRAMELAVPAASAGDVLAALDELGRRHRGSMSSPIGLRMNAADNISLSPCYGRNTLWIDLFYKTSPSVDNALAELAVRFDARAHWGKHLGLPPGSLSERYPKWAAFVDACRRYDPQQLFANDLTNSLGLTGASV
jgi:L-gulonolactone oxidase